MISSNFKIEDRMINMADKYITMIQGDTLSFGIVLEDQYGQATDIDNAIFIAKKNYTDDNRLFEKTIGDGIERDDVGSYTVRVAPEDTINADAGRYYYDLRVGIDDDMYTFMHGIIEIEPRVTN